jgi:hypothetical protein
MDDIQVQRTRSAGKYHGYDYEWMISRHDEVLGVPGASTANGVSRASRYGE